MVGWLCLASHRQQGHLETASQLTVPCKGREAWLLYRSHQELNPGLSRGSPLHNRCATSAPQQPRKVSNNGLIINNPKRDSLWKSTRRAHDCKQISIARLSLR